MSDDTFAVRVTGPAGDWFEWKVTPDEAEKVWDNYGKPDDWALIVPGLVRRHSDLIMELEPELKPGTVMLMEPDNEEVIWGDPKWIVWRLRCALGIPKYAWRFGYQLCRWCGHDHKEFK